MTTMQPLSYMLYSFLYINEWLSLCSCVTFCIIILNFSFCVCVLVYPAHLITFNTHTSRVTSMVFRSTQSIVRENRLSFFYDYCPDAPWPLYLSLHLLSLSLSHPLFLTHTQSLSSFLGPKQRTPPLSQHETKTCV